MFVQHVYEIVLIFTLAKISKQFLEIYKRDHTNIQLRFLLKHSHQNLLIYISRIC